MKFRVFFFVDGLCLFCIALVVIVVGFGDFEFCLELMLFDLGSFVTVGYEIFELSFKVYNLLSSLTMWL